MKIFLYEYASCQPGPVPESLRREGQAMLSALVADARRVGDIQVMTLPAQSTDALEEKAFRQLSAEADLTFVVAPESEGLLRQRHDRVVADGGRWLGATPEALDLTTDKLALAAHLHRLGVPHPPTQLLPIDEKNLPTELYPAVLKPRDGAGSQATMLVNAAAELGACLRTLRIDEGWSGELIAQPLVAGRPASVCFLVGPKELVPLLPGEQLLSADGRFHYLGGRLPLPPPLAERARVLATRAVQAVPGLLGWVGVDLIVGGPVDQVIEINPRLTTSYLGLRQASAANLLGLLLDVWAGKAIEPIRWKEETIRFQIEV